MYKSQQDQNWSRLPIETRKYIRGVYEDQQPLLRYTSRTSFLETLFGEHNLKKKEPLQPDLLFVEKDVADDIFDNREECLKKFPEDQVNGVLLSHIKILSRLFPNQYESKYNKLLKEVEDKEKKIESETIECESSKLPAELPESQSPEEKKVEEVKEESFKPTNTLFPRFEVKRKVIDKITKKILTISGFKEEDNKIFYSFSDPNVSIFLPEDRLEVIEFTNEPPTDLWKFLLNVNWKENIYWNPLMGNIWIKHIDPKGRTITITDGKGVYDVCSDGKDMNRNLAIYPSIRQHNWWKYFEEKSGPKTWSELIKDPSMTDPSSIELINLIENHKDQHVLSKQEVIALKISLLIRYCFGGNIQEEEWKWPDVKKYIPRRAGKYSQHFYIEGGNIRKDEDYKLAFRSENAAKDFISFEENKNLLLEYYPEPIMIL